MVKSILDVEALKRSRQQGIIEGEIKGKREDLLKILHVKQFAKDEIVAKVTNENDAGRLSEWVVAAATIADYGEFKRFVIGRE